MSLLRGLLKAGLINKVVREAQKPQNQQKVKDMYQKAKEKRRPKS